MGTVEFLRGRDPNMDRTLNKQLINLARQESLFLEENSREGSAAVTEKIKEKIPDILKDSLDAAFLKAFQLVFEKGYTYIEKTYNKDKLQLEHDLNNLALDKEFTKKHIRRLDKHAKGSKRLNSFFSVVEGSVLGFLGIGLPDIPLLIAMIIRTISEIALSYGYNYENKEEKIYILLLICGAIARGDVQKETNEAIDCLGEKIDENIPAEINIEEQMEMTGGILSDQLLTAKFIQGIPIVGVIGGAVNYNVIKKIGKYSSLKYKKRYLLGKARAKK